MSSLSPALDRAPAIPESVTPRTTARSGIVFLAGMYILAVVVYGVLGSRQTLPLVSPDEFTYGHLASSIADGGGFTWRGDPVSIRAALYIFVITPSWLVTSGVDAYQLAKATNALLLPMLAIPVWLLTRHLAGLRTAAICAGLSLIGVWMNIAGLILTENLAIPLGVATLAALVMALLAPGSRWGWITFALAAVSASSRMQLVILFPIVGLAMVADAARAGTEWRARLHRHRAHLIAAGVLVAAGALSVAIAGDAVLGSYGGIIHQRPSFAHGLSLIGRTAIGLTAMTAFVPSALLLAFASSRRAWRDDVLGPLLSVTLVAIAVFVVQSGWFTAGQPTNWHIERYVSYVAPLILITALIGVKRGHFDGWRTAGILLALTLLCLAMPRVGSGLEERAYFITTHRVRQVFGSGDASGLAIACLLLGAAGMAALLRSRPRNRWLALSALVGMTLLVQNEASWNWQIHGTRALRSNFPSDLAWMQHDVHGDIAEVLTGINTPEAAIANFFSPNVTRLYKSGQGVAGIDLIGGNCDWIVNGRGQASFDTKCGPAPTRLYLDTHGVRLTFRDERVLAERGRLARVVEVPSNPQLIAFIYQPCGVPGPRIIVRTGEVRQTPTAPCSGSLSGYVFPRTAATLRVHYRGGSSPHYVAVNGSGRLIAPNASVSIDVPLPKGAQNFEIREDWNATAGAPSIESAELIESGHTHEVL